ncbi:MAG TPA: hypothetical protein VFH51_06760 [Myxococcota bacterium]|nr:hypothetical protein [Myxococcota bacterium]
MPPKAFLGDEDAAEREGIRPFDFQLARTLGRTVAELGEMNEREYLHWNRFLAVEASQQELEHKAANARMGR